MSTFAKRSFDAAAYAAARPTYPRALLSHILAFLDQAPPTSSATKPRTLLDLGCGPGLSTFDWLAERRFDRIIGVDPSQGMVAAAREILAQREDQCKGVDVRFEVARADHLEGVVQDESVDLAIAGQAAHWFDAPATYAELARVLKPGGAFAFWGYGEFFFPDRPDLSALIPRYSGGTLGPYWEQPGRSIVEALLVPFPLPSSASPSSSSIPESTAAQFDPSSLTRSFFLRPAPASADAPLPPLPGIDSLPRSSSSSSSHSWTSPPPIPSLAHLHLSRTLLLTKHWTLADLERYLRTWSAAHAHDERRGEGSDVVSGYVRALRDGGMREGERYEVGWEVGIVMGRRKK